MGIFHSSPRNEELSSEEKENSSDLSFDSSEVSFDSSEEISLTSLENFYFPRSYWKFSTWRCRSNRRVSEQCGELYGCIVVRLCIKEEPATRCRDRLLRYLYESDASCYLIS